MLGKGILSKAMAVLLCGLGLAGVSAYAVAGGDDEKSRKAAIGSVAYPDLDLVAMSTTGGFVGETSRYAVQSYATSYIKWNSTKGYRQVLYLVDEVGDGRCMGLWGWGTDAATGKTWPAAKLGEVCHEGSSGTTETQLYADFTAPAGFGSYKSLTIKLCRLAADKRTTDSCVSQVVQPGID
jgi:hypothetical protein